MLNLLRMRAARFRAASIKAARLNQNRLILETMKPTDSARCVACATPSQSRPLPTTLDFATLEQIAPCFEYDADLEQFLRQNDLTYALDEYIRAQNGRATN